MDRKSWIGKILESWEKGKRGRGCGECERMGGELERVGRELNEARCDVGFWKMAHGRARQGWEVAREELRQAGTESTRRELKQSLEAVKEELERVRAYNRSLREQGYGRRSERKRYREKGGEGGGGTEPEAAESSKKRGRAAGTPSHGRREREGLGVKEEQWEPEEEVCRCPGCGREYGRNGEEVSETIEVEVTAHVRRIRRARRRPACGCGVGRELMAPAPGRLFRGTPYGISVWALFLVRVWVHRQPLRAVARELEGFGLEIAAGTLAGSFEGLLRLFEPLEQAIVVRLARAATVHGDETSWPIHGLAERGENPRCWLWICLGADAVRMQVHRTRSAAGAARVLEGVGAEQTAVLVCDRFSAYRTLAHRNPGRFELAYCWAHVRRDFLQQGVRRPGLSQWAQGWMEGITGIYRLNQAGRKHWDRARPATGQQKGYQRTQASLAAAVTGLFRQAQAELQTLPNPDPRRGPLQSLLRHRAGLEVFLAKPEVPMDNNAAERALRGPVIGRKLSFGSYSERGAELTGRLLSVYATLQRAGLNPYQWTLAYLQACADNSGRPSARRCAGLAALGPEPRTSPGLARDARRAGAVSGRSLRRYCGRDFSEDELALIRHLASRRNPPPGRIELSRAVCERLGWRKPDGGLKDMSARVALLRMERDRLLTLPPRRQLPPPPRPPRPSPATDPPASLDLPRSLSDVCPLHLDLLRPRDPRSLLWNEYIQRYHYLGFSRLPGAQLRYFVHSPHRLPLALLGFSAAAWKVGPRDRFIRWNSQTRLRNLPLVVNHARFLILPWARIPHLASHLLALVARCLPHDWFHRYRLRPVLLETFCESRRFRGTCYRAANWIHVGQTQGRGKLDTHNQYALPVKDIFLLPLHPHCQSILNR